MLQIKWICPTAPTRPVALFGGFPCTACKIFILESLITDLGGKSLDLDTT